MNPVSTNLMCLIGSFLRSPAGSAMGRKEGASGLLLEAALWKGSRTFPKGADRQERYLGAGVASDDGGIWVRRPYCARRRGVDMRKKQHQ